MREAPPAAFWAVAANPLVAGAGRADCAWREENGVALVLLGSQELAAVLAAVADAAGGETSKTCSTFDSVSWSLDGSMTCGTGAGASATAGSSIFSSFGGSGVTSASFVSSTAGGVSTFSGSGATSGCGSGALKLSC